VKERIFAAAVMGVPGAQVFGADNSARLWQTYHETFDVCTCLPSVPRAAADWHYRGRGHTTCPGALMMMEPGELHITKKTHGVGTFRVLMIEPRVVLDAAHELGMGRAPHLRLAHCDSPRLYQGFSGFHASLEGSDATTLERQSRFASCLHLLLRYCSERPPVDEATRPLPQSVQRARDLILDLHNTNLTLDDLSEAAGISRYHLVRLFSRQVGVPPHRYLVFVRLERARRLLSRGVPAAEAAAEVGFADQSHLTRHFRRRWGVTPSAYQDCIVEERRRGRTR
jgi:AraC-like DNA-binding protein